jgi:hypothetical protein
MTSASEAGTFAAGWNALDRAERSHLRRLVRMGRPVDPDRGELARQYARYQLGRPWIRYFWLWFVPGMIIVLGAAAQIHPILVGVALALGAQSVWAWFNLRKVARGAG